MEIVSMLTNFGKFYDRGVILNFTSKLPFVSWINQLLNSIIMPSCVEECMWVQDVPMMWFSDCQKAVLL